MGSSMISIDGTARIISDLHLQAGESAVTERFFRFLQDTAASKINALFILGDLFEYWIGDDDLADPFNARICAQLRSLAVTGTQVYFLPGNRDFLLGTQFAEASGVQLMDEPLIVGAATTAHTGASSKTAILLMHGDTLCTDDLAYQAFRSRVRSTQWQRDFLARPIATRRAEVTELRRRSTEAMRGKTPEIMDVNPLAIQIALAESGCSTLIHGHTHRPGREVIHIGDIIAERWVLSDWTANRGDALELNGHGIRRLSLAAPSLSAKT
jgi:UDP-2,3-diacylglucosamine hydrolase